MGTIQNSVNQITGTLMGAAVAGKHLKQQKESNELAKMTQKKEADKELAEALNESDKAANALQKGELEAVESAKLLNPEGWDKATKKVGSETEGSVIHADEVLDEYNAKELDKVMKELQESHVGVDLANMSGNKSKIGKANVRMAKAQMAMNEVADQQEAIRQLRFDDTQATIRVANAMRDKFILGGKK